MPLWVRVLFSPLPEDIPDDVSALNDLHEQIAHGVVSEMMASIPARHMSRITASV